MLRNFQQGFAGTFIIVILLILGIGITVYLAEKPQIFNPKASELTFAEHIIDKTIINGQPYLYNKVTGKIFIPRGNSYANTQQVPDPWGGTSTSGWEWFYPTYDRERVIRDLNKMQSDGYNSVRTAVSPITIGNMEGKPGLNRQMLKNMADFLQLAKERNIFVLLTVRVWPHSGKYAPPNNPNDPLMDTGGGNFFYLSPKALETKKRYLTDLITGLKEEQAPIDNIWAYDIEGEIVFSQNQKPFKNYEGPITTNAGNFMITKNTTKQEKEDIMNKNIIIYVDTLTDIIKSVDPTALVAVQLYPPAMQTPPGQEGSAIYEKYVPAKWLVASPDMVEGDFHGVKADVIALSMYPNTYNQNYLCQISSLQIPGVGGQCNYPLRAGTNKKPIIVEEMGFLRNGAAQGSIPTASQAVPIIKEWMQLECTAGIRGWHLFTWDTIFRPDDGTTVPDYFTAIEENGAINNAIKPNIWPNICNDNLDSGLEVPEQSPKITPTPSPNFEAQGCKSDLDCSSGQICQQMCTASYPAVCKSSCVSKPSSSDNPGTISGQTAGAPPQEFKTADLNQDGKVDISDLTLFVQDYRSGNLRSDLNNDGKVDISDFNQFAQLWRSS